MNNLISRKAVLEIIGKRIENRSNTEDSIWTRNDEAIDIQLAVEELPTAFDMDKVIVNLMNSTYVDEEKCYFIPEETLAIVKRGGKDE